MCCVGYKAGSIRYRVYDKGMWPRVHGTGYRVCSVMILAPRSNTGSGTRYRVYCWSWVRGALAAPWAESPDHLHYNEAFIANSPGGTKGHALGVTARRPNHGGGFIDST